MHDILKNYHSSIDFDKVIQNTLQYFNKLKSNEKSLKKELKFKKCDYLNLNGFMADLFRLHFEVNDSNQDEITVILKVRICLM